MRFPDFRSVDPQKAALIWIGIALASVTLFLFFTGPAYMMVDALGIWVLACVALFFQSRRSISHLTERDSQIMVAVGIVVCAYSFLNVPLGFGNPPYSISDFSILLSGIAIIAFGLLRYASFLVPVSFPLIAVFGYQVYSIFLRHQDWVVAPLLPPLIFFTMLLLHLVGIDAVISGNVISFTSLTGDSIRLAVVGDCSGIWSLGTFAMASLIVLFSFPEGRTRGGLILISLGFIGTYAVNVGRVFLIAISGYLYGSEIIIKVAHDHIGWIIFSAWMIVFWYYFFTRQLGLSLLPTRGISLIRDDRR
ncbi:MAG: exosortase/archaeosortase family protein [Methanomicrobiaceae archaeon]|uniref:Uncharacterized protein n=1 Tax=hydrocarbon metagenome TaxID=938273 RepID=A0A0W8FJ25_9ZZZZ|nr:exosortase/archaeosortase family protein [Methanomicrobiaceae archaeon]